MMRVILRFDDLCPTMKWTVWDSIEEVLDRHGVHPIVAIVPDNRDPKLVVEPENRDFWNRARRWQEKGWLIGQHGYTHVYDSTEAGLVPWWRQSEFAGHPPELQRRRLREGQQALEAEGLHPTVWVAPSHSFDAATLDAVRDLGIRIVSDGVGRHPTVDERGLIWIPAPPWRPALPGGTWTRCVHPNQLRSADELDRFCRAHRARLLGSGFTLDELLADASPRGSSDALYEGLYWKVFGLRRRLREAVRPRRPVPA
jgi:catechol 2,3-dioxygenase-like lactoylglutathione lyase family enzyme